MPWMTKANYAKHRRENGLPGGSPPAVHYAIQDGRITISQEGLIDSEVADKQWAANTNPKFQEAGVKAGAARTKQRRAASKEVAEVPPNLLQMPPTADRNDLNKSRASREFYESELARLKFEEKQHLLIPVETVRRVMYEAGRVIRAGHDDLVAQLSPDLATETDLSRTEIMLKSALERLDNDFADKILAFNDTLGTEQSDADADAA
jgi:hypothetical protein